MDTSMAGFAAYELMQVTTGIALYTTFATANEILRANANLKQRGIESRFVPAGSFVMPSLHH
jgi:hypothetical protein